MTSSNVDHVSVCLQDIDVVDMCLRAVSALASYHYSERIAGNGGLAAHAIDSQGSNGKVQESIVSHFLQMLLQVLLFEDFRLVVGIDYLIYHILKQS